MADNVPITPGTGTTIAADEVVDGTLGTVKVQYVKLMDGTLDGTSKGVIGANGLKVDGSAVIQPISGSLTNISGTVSLPTGAATGTKQDTGNTSLASIDGKITAVNTGAVVVSSSALPTGAATASNQTTANTSLSSIDGKMVGGSGTTGSSTQRVVLATDTTVPNVTGNVASGATDSGNPVKVGSVYNAVSPTYTDGQRSDLQADISGNAKVSQATLLAGENLTYNRTHNLPAYNYTNITTATTTVVKSGSGYLASVIVNTTAAGSVTIYDNTAGSGTKIGTIKASVVEGPQMYNVITTTGVTIVTAAASDITVSWL